MNEDAADALLKDLEEPPPYAVIVLVANDLGPIPETIRSRCQHVPFRRLSERAVREEIEARAPGLEPEQMTALARVAGGRLDRVDRLLDPAAGGAATRCSTLARASTPTRRSSPPRRPPHIARGGRGARGRRREAAGGELERPRPDPARGRPAASPRPAGRRARGAARLARGARRLVPRPRRRRVGRRAGRVHSDRLAELTEDATVERLAAAERGSELVRELWRELEEFNLHAELALEALFVRLRRELALNLVLES